MEVLLLTTLISVAFAVLFLVLFLRDRQRRPFGGVEREALMPLDDVDDPASGAGQVQGPGKRFREECPRPQGVRISQHS